MRSFNKVIVVIGCVLIMLGFVFGIAGIAMGATLDRLTWGGSPDNSPQTFEETCSEEVDSLFLDIDFADVEIRTGDAFRVVASRLGPGYSSEVDDGTWKITYDYESGGRFGLLRGLGFGRWETSEIVIYVPEDFTAESLDISVGAGLLQAEDLSAKTSSLHVGAGKIEIEKLVTGESRIDCGVGQIEVGGSILGDCDIDCGVGDISLTLEGDPQDYRYKASVGIGKLSINDNEYSGISNQSIRGGSDAAYLFSIDCGVGNVELSID